MHCTILRYSGARWRCSRSEPKRPMVSVRPNTTLPAPKAAVTVASVVPVVFMVDGHYGLRRLSPQGAWVIQERYEEQLGCGRRVERHFIRGAPGSLDAALQWLAGRGVDKVLLLQLRHRLTPETLRLRLIP